jgi:hypothetical protein
MSDDQAAEIKRLRAQVAELLELARDLDHDIWTLCGTGTYEMREDLRDDRYPSVTDGEN